MIDNKDFVHLHLHDQYSILDGFGTAKQYCARAKEFGLRSLALTNHGNVDGVIKWQNECKANDIKSIVGVEAYVVPDLRVKKEKEKRYHCVLLAKNSDGFHSLLRMLSVANLDGFYYRPRIDPNLLLENCKDLVVGGACMESYINMPDGIELLKQLGKRTEVYLEVMPHAMPEQAKFNMHVLKVAKDLKVPVVATNDCHYPDPKHAKLQEVLLAMQSKKKWKDKDRWRFSIDTLWLTDVAELHALFEKQGVVIGKALDNAMATTAEIASLCSLEIKKQQVYLPQAPIAGKEHMDEDDQLIQLSVEGMERRRQKHSWIAEADMAIYHERLSEELQSIISQGFTRYFLIVFELITWCLKNDIMVGPGRGSSGGSLVAFALNITQVDPIKYGLVFGRFISEARIDLPDIDMDFEDTKRDKILQHLKDLYGEHNVIGLSTFAKLKGKGVVRNVSRVFDLPLADVNKAAECIVVRSGGDVRTDFCVKDAFETFEDGKNFYKKYPEVSEIAIAMEGQVSGCLSKDTRIMLPRNCKVWPRKIYKLYDQKYRGAVRSYNAESDTFFNDTVVNVVKSGEKPVYELRLGNGKSCKSLKLTADHRVFTKRGWVSAVDLVVGIDKVATNGTRSSLFQKGQQINKGRIPWNKGAKGKQIPWNKDTKGTQVAWNKGLKQPETAERMHTNNPGKLPKTREAVSKRQTKHGLFSIAFSEFLKHNPTCQMCGGKSQHRHHKDLNRRNNLPSNVQALCQNCHNNIVHKIDPSKSFRMLDTTKSRWMYVRSFDFVGIEMTYDITVKSKHSNFLANKIVVHNCGKHAAAMVVSAKDLRTGENSAYAMRTQSLVCNWDKEDAEHMGLMKLDVLGLNSLTLLSECRKLIKQRHGVDVDYESLDLENPEVLKQFHVGNNIGIFQFNSPGMMRLCREIGVEDFGMVVALNTLHRPGSLRSGIATQFQKRKHGEEPVTYPHPFVENITKESYGLIIYQEQVMRFMYDLGGLGWRTADTVRKVISKSKGVEQFLSFKQQFIDGCVNRKTLDAETAEKMFDELKFFGSYSFNKSHSVEYSLIAFWMMWCKVYYPAEFMATILTFGQDAKKADNIQEARRLGLKIRLPDINYSLAKQWTIGEDDSLIVPLSEIKGVGEVASAAISAERQKGGPFKSYEDFESRLAKRSVNRKVKGLLQATACFDGDECRNNMDESKLEELSGFFDFSLSNDPMYRYRKMLQLIKTCVPIHSLRNLQFGGKDKSRYTYFGVMDKLKFGYKEKVNQKMTDVRGTAGDLGGVYGNFKDDTDFVMLVFSSKFYGKHKMEVEHCEGKWMLVQAFNQGSANNVWTDQLWFGDDLLAGKAEGLELKLAKPATYPKGFLQKHDGLYLPGCTECELRKECSAPVMPSAGQFNIMIVGEAPGRDEDRLRQGFVGDSGAALWKRLGQYGLERELFHITNCCKCWPSKTRTPKNQHIKACSKYLLAEIEAVKPFLILSFGNTGLKFFKDQESGIMAASGTCEWSDRFSCWVVYSVHPAAALYSPENKEYVDKGVGALAEKVAQLGFGV